MARSPTSCFHMSSDAAMAVGCSEANGARDTAPHGTRDHARSTVQGHAHRRPVRTASTGDLQPRTPQCTCRTRAGGGTRSADREERHTDGIA